MTFLSQFQQGAIFANDFEVQRPLKEGGMGAVYIARQLSTDKLRALKLMQPQLVREPSLRKRFEHEARVGARIKSSHVVEVIGAGVDEKTGLPWLAMELLEGMDLETRVRVQGSLSREDARQVFEQLCHGMGAAHAAGIVHRDLKPENIFLAQSQQVGSVWMVKVLDFGIAKIRDESQENKTTAAIGTAAYMAPEQTTPGHTISPAADIWAIGLIAFFALTGIQYWRQANLRPNSALGILRELVYEPLVTPTVRAAELGCSQQLPTGFDAWFGRCVTREIEARYENAAEAFRALAPLLDATAPSYRPDEARPTRTEHSDQSIAPRVPQPELDAQKPRHATRRPLTLLALAGGGLASMISLLLWLHPSPSGPFGAALQEQRRQAQSALEDLGVAIERSNGPTTETFAPIHPIPPAVGATLTILEEDHKRTPVSRSAAPPAIPVQPARRAATLPNPEERRCREVNAKLRTACDSGGDAQSCHELGDRFDKGVCSTRKPITAKVMWLRACNIGATAACQHLR